MILAGVLAVALASFSADDPSWNHATGLPASNLLGEAGASFADVALRMTGLAALAPVLALSAWGWLLMGRHGIHRPCARSAGVLFATAVGTMALATCPTPASWPLPGGLGGLAGDALLATIIGMTGITSMATTGAAAALVSGVVLFWSCEITWRELKAIPRQLLRTAQAVGSGIRRASAWTLAVANHASGHMRRALTLARARPRCDEPNPSKQHLSDPSIDTATATTGGDGMIAPRDKIRHDAEPERTPSVVPPATMGQKAAKGRQGSLNLQDGEEQSYRPPPLDALRAPAAKVVDDGLNHDALQQNARMLSGVLEDFGVRGEIDRVRPGPVITLYELEPAPGTKTSRVIGLADDIARSMSAVSVRVAVVPGRNVIGIELPNHRRETVYLRELLAAEGFEQAGSTLTLALGKDIGGAPVYVDLTRMPHLLIAGTTGSGKSVAINTMILSLIYRRSPETCRLILIDPKMLELSVYDGIPHLLTPVVTDPAKAVVALKWTVREMEERYRMMSQLGVRNIAGFNARVSEARAKGEALIRRVQTGFDEDGHPVYEDQSLDLEPLPFIVVIVDEMADLMLVAGKDIEAAVQRLAQMARAAGIHLILATQRPSVDVITGTIKANFPTRISFRVASKIDSRTILGEMGAEQLLGQGDMLYMAGGGRVSRVHGPFVADDEVETIVRHLQSQGEPHYVASVTDESDVDQVRPTDGAFEASEDGDQLYDEALAVVARDGKASTSYVQRRLQIGYNRAARLIERMESEGVVSKPDRVGRREVLVGDHAS